MGKRNFHRFLSDTHFVVPTCMVGINSKDKGNIAVAKAINFFTENGYNILLPFGDNRPYDLVVETPEGVLKKVQCKFTSYKQGDSFVVPLRVCGGNRSRSTAKKYVEGDFDIIFAWNADGVGYVVPYDVVKGKSTFTLSEKYSEFKVG